MGLCADKSINHLAGLGLNTILHPQENIPPLSLLGEADGQRALIGTLDQLVKHPSAPSPTITTAAAGNINGQRSSKLPIDLGINLLGNIISAMGGNLGIGAAYEHAQRIEFAYTGVARDRANVIQIGDYLQGVSIRWHHPILQEYLFGKGNLYVLTETVRSAELSVTAYDAHKASLSLDVPEIRQIIGGKIGVASEGSGNTTVSYKGDRQLVFGFVAIELSAADNHDGELHLAFRPVRAGGVALGLAAPAIVPTLFPGPLQTLPALDLAALAR